MFIAQPPLYKATRGKSERYLKDEREFENYLIGEGSAGASFTLHTGESVAGSISMRWWRRRAPRRRRGRFSAALSALPSGAGGDRGRAQSRHPERQGEGVGGRDLYRAPSRPAVRRAGARLARRADAGRGLKFWREVRGVREAVAIDGALIGSADARKLDRMAAELQQAYLNPEPSSARTRNARCARRANC